MTGPWRNSTRTGREVEKTWHSLHRAIAPRVESLAPRCGNGNLRILDPESGDVLHDVC